MALIIPEDAIGIMDSGVGGISVMNVLMHELPRENIIYFGDTAHMPYGKCSLNEVRSFTEKIIDFFIDKKCKLIVIACNTATASLERTSEEVYKGEVPIFNVIDPVARYVNEHYSHKKVGLLCTDLTHSTGIFERKIEDTGVDIKLISFRATQLAHMIETEFEHSEQIKQLIREYFFHHQFKNVEAVILGCTHYIWLKESFIKLNPFIDWIEPSTMLVSEIKSYLIKSDRLNKSEKMPQKSRACIIQSGNFPDFFAMAKTMTPATFDKQFISLSL